LLGRPLRIEEYVMRKLIFAATALAIAAPAAAQPPRYDYSGYGGRVVPPAREIERAGDSIARFTDALMGLDIAPLADAIDPARRFERRRPVETLGDLATRNDPYARERIQDSIADTTVGLGAAVQEVAVLTPVLGRAIEDAARRMDYAVRESRLRRERDYDRGYRGYEDGYRR
jgi:hypothetical protein